MNIKLIIKPLGMLSAGLLFLSHLATAAPTIGAVTTSAVPTSGPTAFRPLGDWSVQIESARIARDSQIEVVANLKNISREAASLGAGDITMILTDADGVGITNIGNLYRVGGAPAMIPETLEGGPVGSGAQMRVLFLFDVPEGETPLRTLTIVGLGAETKPLTFDMAGLTLPTPTVAVSVPVAQTVGGQNRFFPMNGFGVRFDGARRGANGALHVFVTAKNLDPAKFQSHPAYDLDIAALDQDGLAHQTDGNLYRASGGDLDLIRVKHNVVLLPGGAATLCYLIPLSPKAVPRQLLFKLNDKQSSVALPAFP